MIILSKYFQSNVKKVHCPICGGRLFDVNTSNKVFLNNNYKQSEIVMKCHKCRNQIGVTVIID